MRAFLSFCAGLLLLTTGSPRAEPLFDPEDGPFTGVFGWPTSTEDAHLAPAGEADWKVQVTASSHSVFESTDEELLVFDGETTRLWLDYRFGISARLEVGILAPWVWHESGGMDSLISSWHDFFGLPQGNRDRWPEDRLLFEYGAADESLSVARNSNGPGDMRLTAGWLLRQGDDNRLALRAAVKLPTGDSRKLLGSGATDLSLGLAGERSGLWHNEALSGFYRISAVYLGTPDLLASRSRHLAGQASAGVDYQWTTNIGITAQTTVRSAAYDGTATALGEWAMSLHAGLRFRLPGDWRLAVAFAEDVKVESTPDVTFLLTVSGPSRRAPAPRGHPDTP